jgi:hypothetical protein
VLLPLKVWGESLQLYSILLPAEKMIHWGCLNAIAPWMLVHIVDHKRGKNFLIDTEASYSTFPH